MVVAGIHRTTDRNSARYLERSACLAPLPSPLPYALQAVLAPVASSADISRAEYVEQSEPICKANTNANKNILKGVREDVREGKLKVAGAKFSRAARALNQTIQKPELIPRPSADESRHGEESGDPGRVAQPSYGSRRNCTAGWFRGSDRLIQGRAEPRGSSENVAHSCAHTGRRRS